MEAIVLDVFGGLLEETHYISHLLFPGIDKSTQAYKLFKTKYNQLCRGKAAESELSELAKQLGLDYEAAKQEMLQNIHAVLDLSVKQFRIPVYLFTHMYSVVYDILNTIQIEHIPKKVFLTSEIKLNKIAAISVVADELSEKHNLSQVAIVDDKKEILQAAKKAGFGLTVLRVCETVPAENMEGIDLVIHKLSDLIESELR